MCALGAPLCSSQRTRRCGGQRSACCATHFVLHDRLSRPTSLADSRGPRDPDADGGSGDSIARAPPRAQPPTLVALARSPPPPSPPPSAPSSPSIKRGHASKNMLDMRLDKLPNLNAYVAEIAKCELALPSACPVLHVVSAPGSAYLKGRCWWSGTRAALTGSACASPQLARCSRDQIRLRMAALARG